MNNPTFIVESNDLFREGLRLILEKAMFHVIGTGATLKDLRNPPESQPAELFVIGEPVAEPVSKIIEEILSKYERARIVVLSNSYDQQLSAACLELGAKGYLHKGLSTASFVRALQLISDTYSVVAGWPATSEDRAPWSSGVSLSIAAAAPARKTSASQTPAAASCDGDSNEFDGIGDKLIGGYHDIPLHRELSDLRTRGLSPREAAIMQLLMSGQSNKQIARQLDIMEGTVKVHVKTILRKIQVKNRTQAAIWAMADPRFAAFSH